MQPYPERMGFGGQMQEVPVGNQFAEQQAQESLFLEELTQRLSQMGPSSSSQQDCIRKLKSLNLDDHFWMYIFKVAPCTRSYAHKWTLCPCAHAGETARRRDPRTSNYKAVLCPLVKAKKVCPLGDACSYSHNVFEHWLHPSRYKTRLCSFGNSCNRSICFFAHATEELRCVPNMDDGKEVDEREFLMQLMMAQESGLLPGGGGLPLQPQEQQQQQPQHQQSPQQLPVLYTMAQEALQQPMQVLAQPMRSSSSGLNVSTSEARRHAPARSLTGIPMSYRQSMPGHLQSPHLNAVSSAFNELPSRVHAHSVNGSLSSAPPSTLQLPPAGESTYLKLQETLASLGLNGSAALRSPATMGCGIRSADQVYADNAAAVLHGLQPMPSGEQPQDTYCTRGATTVYQRTSDPGMHALLNGGGGGASSDDEGYMGSLAGANRVSDSGKPMGGLGQGHLMPPKELAESLGNLLPLMNMAQKQQKAAAVTAAAVDIAAGYPGPGQGPSSSPPSSSLASSGSARSSSPPTSYDTNASVAAASMLASAACTPSNTLGSPHLTGLQKQASLLPHMQQQQQQQLKQEDLRALAASAGQASCISASYVTKILTDLHEQGLAGTKEQLVASLSQLLAHLLSVP